MAIQLTGDKPFDMFWTAWVKHTGKATDKGDAQAEFKKAIKGQENKIEFAQTLVFAIESQARYKNRAQGMGKFVPEFKAPHRWLKSHKWLDEMQSLDRLEERASITQACKECGQVYEGKGTQFQNGQIVLCNGCYPDSHGFKRKGYDKMIELKHGKNDFSTEREWQQACKQYCIGHGYKAGNRGKLAGALPVPDRPENSGDGAENAPDYLEDLSRGKI